MDRFATEPFTEWSFNQDYLALFVNWEGSVFRRVAEAATVIPGKRPIAGHESWLGGYPGQGCSILCPSTKEAHPLRCSAVAFLAVMLAPVLPGQVSTGTIHVDVRDTSGAAITQAVITLTHVSTGLTRLGKSNEQGEFVASFVPLGPYSIAV